MKIKLSKKQYIKRNNSMELCVTVDERWHYNRILQLDRIKEIPLAVEDAIHDISVIMVKGAIEYWMQNNFIQERKDLLEEQFIWSDEAKECITEIEAYINDTYEKNI